MKKMFVICCMGFAFQGFAQAKPVQKSTSKAAHTKTLLQGDWWGDEYDEHAVFTIDGDYITYIEHFDKFKYHLSGDTFDLVTKQQHYKQVIVRLTKDTLIFRELPSKEVHGYGHGQ